MLIKSTALNSKLLNFDKSTRSTSELSKRSDLSNNIKTRKSYQFSHFNNRNSMEQYWYGNMFSKCLSKPKGPYTPPVEDNGSETSSGSDEGHISSKSYERLISKEENNKWKTPSVEENESESSSDSEEGQNISSKSDEKRLITKRDNNKENKVELKKLQKQNKVSS